MGSIILERGDVRSLRFFIREAVRWCYCGMCELCKARNRVEIRLGEMVPWGKEVPSRLPFKEEDLQLLIALIDAAREAHFCVTPYEESFCDLCSSRGEFERRVLALSR
jgi:hypothetical protein